MGPAIFGGLHRSHEGYLDLRAPAGLMAAALATEAGVVDLALPVSRRSASASRMLSRAETLVLDWVSSRIAGNPLARCSLLDAKIVPLRTLHGYWHPAHCP